MRLSQDSKINSERLIAWRLPLRILIASLACSEAMMLTIGARMPAVSQVGVVPGGGVSLHQAAQAGGFAGQDGHRLPFGPQAAAVDPGNPALQGDVVEQHAGFEIVGAVEDHVDALGQIHDVGVIDVGDQRLDRDLRVDFSQLGRRGNGLGQAGCDVVLVEQHLPLQVVDFQKVAIDDRAACRRPPAPACWQ